MYFPVGMLSAQQKNAHDFAWLHLSKWWIFGMFVSFVMDSFVRWTNGMC